MRASTDKRLVITPGRAVGKIISTPVVQSRAAQSAMTTTALSTDGRDQVRPRRFAIVEEHPGNRHSFRAVPLKTYDGAGVTHQIKVLHAPIYSSKKGPAYLNSEGPRPFEGQLEDPMQSPAIRVTPSNRGSELDGYSRLDYFEWIEFEFDDPLVVRFGKVHEESYDDFLEQWNRTRAHILNVLRASPPSHSSEGSAARMQQRITPAIGITITSPAAAAGPSSAAGRRGNVSRQTSNAAQNVNTRAAVDAVLANLEKYAEDNDLDWPAKITAVGRQRMAEDRELLETTIGGIRDSLKRQMRAKNPDAESSSEGSEDDGQEDEEDE